MIEEERLIIFLLGLNESLAVIRSQIMAKELQPSIDKAFFILAQEEQQRSIIINDHESIKALAVK